MSDESSFLRGVLHHAPTRAASLTTLASSCVAAVGVVGQIAVRGSVLFAMLSAAGLSALAAVVFVHQRR